jgi:myo-inositol-1(or 4)-monophosphatase
VDAMLKTRLLAARPDHGWLSEETTDDPARLTKSKLFIIDPIDGTRAYVKGRPWFTVCIAAVRDGRPVAAVVHAPALEETYEATLGGGARLNGQPIQASATQDLAGAAMMGDAAMFADPRWPTPWPHMRVESRNSIAYRMMLVASGAFDAALALGKKGEWDLAAADLIASEAGARVTDHLGHPFTYNQPDPERPSLLCAPPALHRLILQRVDHIDPRVHDTP